MSSAPVRAQVRLVTHAMTAPPRVSRTTGLTAASSDRHRHCEKVTTTNKSAARRGGSGGEQLDRNGTDQPACTEDAGWNARHGRARKHRPDRAAAVHRAGGDPASGRRTHPATALLNSKADVRIAEAGADPLPTPTTTRVHGNRIVSYLQVFHSTATDPARIVTIAPASGLVTNGIIAPYTNETWSQYVASDKLVLTR